jgi:hypothetical protein
MTETTDIETSIGAFIIQFGKTEYAMMRVIEEVNRIVDGTTIQSKMPYGISEMCNFLKRVAPQFEQEILISKLADVAAEAEDLNNLRSTLVHSYLSKLEINQQNATWYTFDRFVKPDKGKNVRRLESVKMTKKFVDDATQDLLDARLWFIEMRHKMATLPPRYVV